MFSGFVMHASAIKHNNNAIVFTAPSGTGKTTMAHLWKKFKNATILNDENIAIRSLDSNSIVFGLPWCDETQSYVNDNAPLKAIIVLEQALENQIRLLDHQEYISRVLPRVFLPYFDSKIMDLAVSHFEKVVKSVPIYLLQCRPDFEAVELVHRCVI
jgi:hypothetical protein